MMIQQVEENKIKVVCFGEILWDIFPGEQRRAGGAPFNVVYNLSKMGINTRMISCVGDDVLGHELLSKIKGWNIPSEGIQITPKHPTSTVIAAIDEHNEAHYEIVENVAWDFIKATPADKLLLKETDALVFGSLATRNEKSRNTLFELVEISAYNVFDINLRKPHYDTHIIKELLYKTKLAKFNKAELLMMLDVLGKEYISESDSVKYFQDKFGMKEIIVSKGSKGALYANEENIYLYPAVNVQIKDTVGSGDSFLAGFLSKRLEKGVSIHDMVLQAVSLGAFVTSHEGACPAYTLEEFELFREAHATAIFAL